MRIACGITPVLMLTEIMSELGQHEQAKARLIRELQKRPTVRGINRLVDYSLVGASRESRENLTLLKEFTVSLIENKYSYLCGNCGFQGRTLHWQCPGCKFWNSVKPVHGIEGE